MNLNVDELFGFRDETTLHIVSNQEHNIIIIQRAVAFDILAKSTNPRRYANNIVKGKRVLRTRKALANFFKKKTKIIVRVRI